MAAPTCDGRGPDASATSLSNSRPASMRTGNGSIAAATRTSSALRWACAARCGATSAIRWRTRTSTCRRGGGSRRAGRCWRARAAAASPSRPGMPTSPRPIPTTAGASSTTAPCRWRDWCSRRAMRGACTPPGGGVSRRRPSMNWVTAPMAPPAWRSTCVRPSAAMSSWVRSGGRRAGRRWRRRCSVPIPATNSPWRAMSADAAATATSVPRAGRDSNCNPTCRSAMRGACSSRTPGWTRHSATASRSARPPAAPRPGCRSPRARAFPASRASKRHCGCVGRVSGGTRRRSWWAWTMSPSTTRAASVRPATDCSTWKQAATGRGRAAACRRSPASTTRWTGSTSAR